MNWKRNENCKENQTVKIIITKREKTAIAKITEVNWEVHEKEVILMN